MAIPLASAFIIDFVFSRQMIDAVISIARHTLYQEFKVWLGLSKGKKNRSSMNHILPISTKKTKTLPEGRLLQS